MTGRDRNTLLRALESWRAQVDRMDDLQLTEAVLAEPELLWNLQEIDALRSRIERDEIE